MIFTKFSFILIVYNFVVGPTNALDAPPPYQYYQTTRFSTPKEWPPKQIDPHYNPAPATYPATTSSLQQPTAFYIVPMAVKLLKTQTAQTTPTSAPLPHPTTQSSIALSTDQPPNILLQPPETAAMFPNKLPPDIEETSALSLPPLNPAPMLKPNPFVNNLGHQITFSTKSGGAAGGTSADNSNKLQGPPRREEGSFCRRSFDGHSGYCILAFQCLHVIREYRIHGTKIDICTYRKNIPVICCPLADKHIEYQRKSVQKCQENHVAVRGIKLEEPRALSGKTCVTSVPLIVGGKITRKKEYPHMAAIGWTQDNNELKWGCGGTLVSEFYVLTAAHCTTSGGEPPDTVRLGAENLNRTSKHHMDVKILIIILHPKYHSSLYYHDIALLKLTKRVRFSSYIQPACLWQLPDIEMPSAVATGWGRTEFLGHKSDDLQKVDLNIIDQKTCADVYRKERRLPHGIMEDQFCAGHLEGGKDTCQGDSGGPLHAELPEYNCVKFVIGITSFGKFCATPNGPGVYTKIYSYLDWIEKIVFRN